MTDFRDDIEKYLSGDLSPSEMHALEKKALGDPFLADALEGGSSVSRDDFSDDVRTLNQRLKNRESGTRWLSPLRIAAGIILIVGASFAIYNFLDKEPVRIAEISTKKASEPPVKSNADSAPAFKKEADAFKKKAQQGDPTQKLLSLNQPAVAPTKESTKPVTTAIDSSQSNDIVGEEKVASGLAVISDTVQRLKIAETETAYAPVLRDLKESTKDAASVAKSKSGDDTDRRSSAAGAAMALSRSRQKTIRGKVTSMEDGSAIPGANILIQGTDQGTVTDVNGNYQLVTPATKDSLVISFIGYSTREVKIPSNDLNVDVSLPVDATQLNEVIVVGYGSSNRVNDDEMPIQLAEPVGGKKAYNEYLETHLRYPQPALSQKIEGKVTVEFSVGTAGEMSEFKVLRGIGYGCNEEVIRLVKDGPEWKPSRQGSVKLESTVRVRVKFKLPK